jgi:hypothetical protein
LKLGTNTDTNSMVRLVSDTDVFGYPMGRLALASIVPKSSRNWLPNAEI